VHATASEGADGTTGFQTGEEHDLRSFKKMLFAAVVTMAIAAGATVSTAGAVITPPAAPTGVLPSEGRYTQDANAPYLAWQGEHVRLVACSKDLTFSGAATATWMLVDPLNWPDFAPAFDPASVTVSGHCVYADWISDKPGLAAIKVIVSDPKAETDLAVSTASTFTKDFLVGWMELLKPTAVGGGDVFAADFCDQPKFDTLTQESISLLGPYSNCWHADPPVDPRSRIKITVKGNLPLEADFSNYGLGDHLTLPDDWGKWAAVAATSTDDHPLSVGAISNWDDHDDSALTEGHVIFPGQCADQEIYINFDSVDNCNTEGPDGGFSTVLGPQATDGQTIGPFDPIYSFDTMLSDGKVDAGDAPMPAAQIDVSIKDNNPADPTDISGVGYLHPSYKTEVYSRDGLGSDWWGNLAPNKAHNLYAPFYDQYIPATARPTNATGSPYGPNAPVSGITGTGQFPGTGEFLVNGLYRNWAFAKIWAYHPKAWSKCLFSQLPLGLGRPINRPLPYGNSDVSVYTDESGEANINYVPGLGMYFDNLSGANKNLNGGCDLEGIHTLGTAEVDVVARYPYQTVTARSQAADPVRFNVLNKFQKALTVYSKGADANGITSNSLAKIVLAHAQDIDGSPLAYELVCWMANKNAEGLRVFAGDLPAPTATDPLAVISLDPYHALFTTFKDPIGLNRLCTFTDRWGNSAIEVFNSDQTSVNVIAEFVNEGILRDTIADFSPTSRGQGVTTSADGPPTSHVPSAATQQNAVVVSASGPVLAAKPAITTIKSKQAKLHKKALYKIRFAKVVTPLHKKATLVVRVNGKAGMVGLKITILKKGGKVHTYTRFVPANVKMAVKHLSVPNKTAKVTVKVIGL
jgi:hypothetical protein